MPPLTLLRNARIFTPEPYGPGDVLIGGERILALGPHLPDLPAELCATVDLGGARLIPGLIDSHVHVTGGGGESGPASRVPRVVFSALTRGGITTCVGVLGTDGTTRTVAELVASTLALRAEGLSAFCWTGSYEVPPITLTGSVRGDVVFVDPVIGVGEVAISDHRSSQPTNDEIARLAADCHVAGLMTGKAGVLHLHLGNGARGLSVVNALLDGTELPPRTFHPTHCNRRKALFEEAVALARRGCTIDVTAFPVDDPPQAGIASDHDEGEDAWSAPDAIERYLDAGAPVDRITCSSDGGGCLPQYDGQGNLTSIDIGQPGAVAEALAHLLARGRALEEVLPIFTSNVASLLRLHGKGRIEVGRDADLVVLDDDHRVHDVIARGRFVVLRKEPQVWGAFEQAKA